LHRGAILHGDSPDSNQRPGGQERASRRSNGYVRASGKADDRRASEADDCGCPDGGREARGIDPGSGQGGFLKLARSA